MCRDAPRRQRLEAVLSLSSLSPSPFRRGASPLSPSPCGSSPLSLRVLTPCPPLPSGPHPLSPSPFGRGGTNEEFDCAARRNSGCASRPVVGHAPPMDPLRRLRAAERFALARGLRRGPTPAERHAWTLLRNRGMLGLKFRRQHVLHGFIVDFCCLSERIVVELEGDGHDSEAQRNYDRSRAGFLEAAGYRVIRVRNRDVSRERLEAVLREAMGTDR